MSDVVHMDSNRHCADAATLIIWGAGGHGRVVLDVASASNRFRTILFVDDGPISAVRELPVLTPAAALSLAPVGTAFVAAIGDNHARSRAYARGVAAGWNPATLVHPSAVVSSSAAVGPGTVILPRAVINAGAVIGANCIVNTNATVEHDCRIGDHAHVSPAAALGGGSVVGRLAHLGIGAILLPRAEVGEGSVVGAGAVVLVTVPAWRTVVGIPARELARLTAV